MIDSELKDITIPELVEELSNQDLLSGIHISPIDRIAIFSDKQFELFINEWASGYLKDKYVTVLRSGGAGDMGRDVVGYLDSHMQKWDNYQCKHYKSPLDISTILFEIGKLIYNCYSQNFTVPEKYFFVAPKDFAPKSIRLFEDKVKLKAELLRQWNTICEKKITTSKNIKLTKELEDYILQFDFDIFKLKPILTVIDEHSKTRWHSYRFGGGMKKYKREKVEVPGSVKEKEMIYVNKLLDAYKEHLGKTSLEVTDLKKLPLLFSHFNRQRECFYSAEFLGIIERDTLPPNTKAFEHLKDTIYDFVIDICEGDAKDGYERVIKVVQEAAKAPIDNNPLNSNVSVKDKKGVCHHLANEDKLKWVQ